MVRGPDDHQQERIVRVEGTSLPPSGDLDPRTRAKQYLGAIRRRGYLIVALAFLGGAAGWVTAPAPVEVDEVGTVTSGPTFIRATHVLIVDDTAADSEGRSSVNLSQAAYLVNTGQVPQRVAARLELPLAEVESSLLGLPRTQVNSVEVQAFGADLDRTVAIADAAAQELIVLLGEQAQQDAERTRDLVITRMDDLDAQISALNGQIAANPPNRLQLEAQQRSVTNQYSLVYEQFSQLANRPPASAGLSSLQGAQAQSISKAAYDQAKSTIRDGADYVTGAQPQAEAVLATTTPPAVEEPASRPMRAATGAVGGLAVGVVLVLVLDRFDNRLRRREDIEASSGLTVLAELPPLSRKEQQGLEVVANTQHRSRAAEAYRVIRGAILFAETGGQEAAPRDEALVIMITSGNPAEGKTTVTANLAAVLAEGGLDVLVVNCDFRRPRVHKYLRPADGRQPLLAAGPSGTVTLTDTQIDRVRLVTGVGEDDPNANPLDIVAMQRKIVETAKNRYDVILLDTAPFLTTNDASELLGVTDHVLVVVRAGKSRSDALSRCSEILDRLEAPVLGLVVNDSRDQQAAQYYYGYTGDERRRSDRDASSSDGPNAGSDVSPLARVRSAASGR
jgi:capsular exopolysaccharide synthesis family protein